MLFTSSAGSEHLRMMTVSQQEDVIGGNARVYDHDGLASAQQGAHTQLAYDFFVVSGDDAITLPLVLLGCDEVISVVANAFQKEFSEMVRAALNQDVVRSRKLHYKLLEIINLLFREGNPAGVKGALELQGVWGTQVRLPLVPPTDVLMKDLQTAIRNLKGVKTLA